MSDDEKILKKDEIEELNSTDVVPYKQENNTEVIEKNNQEVIDQEFNKRSVDLRNDYEYARTNIYDTISQGSDALFELTNLAKNSQSPRAYEVLAKLMDTITNSNEKLVNIHQQVKDIEKVEKGSQNSQSAGTINNIVFHGTTEELFDAIEDKRKDKNNGGS